MYRASRPWQRGCTPCTRRRSSPTHIPGQDRAARVGKESAPGRGGEVRTTYAFAGRASGQHQPVGLFIPAGRIRSAAVTADSAARRSGRSAGASLAEFTTPLQPLSSSGGQVKQVDVKIEKRPASERRSMRQHPLPSPCVALLFGRGFDREESSSHKNAGEGIHSDQRKQPSSCRCCGAGEATSTSLRWRISAWDRQSPW